MPQTCSRAEAEVLPILTHEFCGRAEKKEYQLELKEWRDNGGNPETKPIEPRPERIIVNDTTVEGLIRILQENPRGVILMRDELAGWIKAMNQYKKSGGSDIEFYLSAWSGGDYILDRRSQDDPTDVENMYLAVCGSCQPNVMTRLLKGQQQDNGFASRILFAYPQPPKRQWSEKEISKKNYNRVNLLFNDLAHLHLCEEPRIVRLSPDGRMALREVMNDHFEDRELYENS